MFRAVQSILFTACWWMKKESLQCLHFTHLSTFLLLVSHLYLMHHRFLNFQSLQIRFRSWTHVWYVTPAAVSTFHTLFSKLLQHTLPSMANYCALQCRWSRLHIYSLLFISLDEKQRKSFHRREPQRIELGAIFDTTCKKCGGKGMFLCKNSEGCAKNKQDLSQELIRHWIVRLTKLWISLM